MAALKEMFVTSYGSVRGLRSKKLGKNNQDAVAVMHSDDRIVAVVTDGCGSTEHAEVGAKLGA